jgi:hypothetical protein
MSSKPASFALLTLFLVLNSREPQSLGKGTQRGDGSFDWKHSFEFGTPRCWTFAHCNRQGRLRVILDRASRSSLVSDVRFDLEATNFRIATKLRDGPEGDICREIPTRRT